LASRPPLRAPLLGLSVEIDRIVALHDLDCATLAGSIGIVQRDHHRRLSASSRFGINLAIGLVGKTEELLDLLPQSGTFGAREAAYIVVVKPGVDQVILHLFGRLAATVKTNELL